MQLFHFYHHHYYKLAQSDFWLYELSVWLHTLARSFISIFIPILMLKAGYSVEAVIAYYVIYNAIDVPFNFVARRLIRAIGARRVIVIGSVMSIAFFLTLSIIGRGWGWFLLLAFFAAIYDTLYWVAHRFLFAEANEGQADVGRNVGILYGVQRLAGMLGPAIGAAILIFGNQYILIGVGSVVFALSIIPLLYAGHLPDKPSKPQVSFREFFREPKERRNYLLTSLYAVHAAAEDMLWPLFIFVTFGTLESVAVVPIIVSVSAIVFSYFTGEAEKKYRKGKMITLGALVIAAIWILRIFVPLPAFYYASVFIVGLASILVSVPIDTRIYDRGRRLDPLSSSTYTNTSHMFAKFLLYAVLALLVNVFHVSFVLAAASLIAIIAVNDVVFRRRQPIAYQKSAT
jgi:MFS family permease